LDHEPGRNSVTVAIIAVSSTRDDLAGFECEPRVAGRARRKVYLVEMRFEKVWVKQCGATRAIKTRFGAKTALDYLISEKLAIFADEAERNPEFAAELPRFLAAIWQVFNQYEIAGYEASQKPTARSNCANCFT
jgi:hypothetical protein